LYVLTQLTPHISEKIPPALELIFIQVTKKYGEGDEAKKRGK
jgi:hypothetical protein